MRVFELHRDLDETGVSGVGVVARGVEFDDGTCAMRWLTERASTSTYDSLEDVVAIHGHGGKTRVVVVADFDVEAVRGLVDNASQDRAEGVFPSLGNWGRYLWEQREKFVDVFRRREVS